jgi:hypothetical protein
VLKPRIGNHLGHKRFSHFSLNAARFTSTYQKSNAQVLTTTTPVKSRTKPATPLQHHNPNRNVRAKSPLISRKALGRSFPSSFEKAIRLAQTAVSKHLQSQLNHQQKQPA